MTNFYLINGGQIAMSYSGATGTPALDFEQFLLDQWWTNCHVLFWGHWYPCFRFLLNIMTSYFFKKWSEAQKGVAILGHLLVNSGGPGGTSGDQWPPGHRQVILCIVYASKHLARLRNLAGISLWVLYKYFSEASPPDHRFCGLNFCHPANPLHEIGPIVLASLHKSWILTCFSPMAT